TSQVCELMHHNIPHRYTSACTTTYLTGIRANAPQHTSQVYELMHHNIPHRYAS
ncbi:predicted protein, partial [Nematostella vectensis]